MTGSMEIADVKDVSMFTEHVGSLFHIEVGPDQFAEARLVEAEALNIGPRKSESLPREPFSLLFELQGDIDLQQQNYRVSHDQLGELPLFLVPVGKDQMESIFN